MSFDTVVALRLERMANADIRSATANALIKKNGGLSQLFHIGVNYNHNGIPH